jgi:hypothetical protein
MDEAYEEIMKLISQIPECKGIRQREGIASRIKQHFLFYVGEANSAIDELGVIQDVFGEDDEF